MAPSFCPSDSASFNCVQVPSFHQGRLDISYRQLHARERPGKCQIKGKAFSRWYVDFQATPFSDNGHLPIARTWDDPPTIGEVNHSDTEQHLPRDGFYIGCWSGYHTTFDGEDRSRDR